MVMAIQPAAAHICVRPNGQRVAAPALSLVEPVGRGRGGLYVLLEPLFARDNGEVADEVIASIEHEFARGSARSLTSALIGAVQSANETLYARNRRSTPRAQCRLGAVCATLKGDTLYVAQVGGASAWLCRDGRVRSIRPVDAPPKAKLGVNDRLDPDLVAVQLQVGDRVLFATGGLVAPGSRLAVALAQPNADLAIEAVANTHARANAVNDLALLVVTYDASGATVSRPREVIAATPPDTLAPEPPRSRYPRRETPLMPRPAAEIDGDADSRSVDPDFEAPTTRRPRRAPGGGLAAFAAGVLAGLAAVAMWIGREIYNMFFGSPATTRASTAEAAPAVEPPTRRLPASESPRRAAPAPTDRQRYLPIAAPAAELTPPPRRARPASRPAASLVALSVLLGVIVVGAAGFGGYVLVTGFLRERSTSDEQARLVAEAEVKVAAAQTEIDPGRKRQLLEDARTLVVQTQRTVKDNQRATDVMKKVDDYLDQLDRRAHLYSPIELLTAEQIGQDASISQFVVSDKNNYLFTLDSSGGRVNGFLITPNSGIRPLQNRPIVQRDLQFGQKTLGQIAAIAWISGSQSRPNGALLVMDTAGVVVEHDPDANRQTVTDIGGNWGQVRQTMAWGGQLYVLDTKLRQVLRYAATGGGFKSEPETYLAREVTLDFANITDLAVDGNVWLLSSDGQIRKFANGKPAPFAAQDVFPPFKEASRLFMTSTSKSLYVLDAPNRRVVQLSKIGEYERQFLYTGPQPIFDASQSFFIDEPRHKLYLLSGNRLWSLELPRNDRGG